MCSDLGSASQCCAYYSVIGVFFMLWVWLMLAKQPFYMGGFESLEQVDFARNNAKAATLMFVLSFAASIYGLYFHSRKSKTGNAENMDMIPLAGSRGVNSYQVEPRYPYRD